MRCGIVRVMLLFVLVAVLCFDIYVLFGDFRDPPLDTEPEKDILLDRHVRHELQRQRRLREHVEKEESANEDAVDPDVFTDVFTLNSPGGEPAVLTEEPDSDPGPDRLTSGVMLPTGLTHTVTQRSIPFDLGDRLHFSSWEMRMPIYPESDAELMKKLFSEKWYSNLTSGRFVVGGPNIELSSQPKLYRQVRMPERDALLCGAESPENLTLSRAPGPPSVFIVPLNVPMGGWWDHFQDGVLPKLVMLMPWARGATVVTDAWNKTMVKNIWELGKILGVNVVTEFPTVTTSVDILWGCHLPSLHPRQFKRLRKLVLFETRLPDVAVKDVKRCSVFYALRNLATSIKGRFLPNEKKVMEMLFSMFPGRLWVWKYDEKEPLIETLKKMSSVCLGIGPHGSALHNFLYAAQDAPLIEITDGQGTTNTHQQIAVMLGRLVGAVGYVGSDYQPNGRARPQGTPGGGVPVSLQALTDVIRAVVTRHPTLSNASWIRFADRPIETPLVGL